jgi:hypothetical protein
MSSIELAVAGAVWLELGFDKITVAETHAIKANINGLVRSAQHIGISPSSFGSSKDEPSKLS